MNFSWDPTTIKWYQDANAYSQFFKNIADFIAPSLNGYTTLCDIGCGLGLIDLELSKHIDHITCIDINEFALNSLKTTIAKQRITNIEPRLLNCDDIQNTWDVIYTSFFGSREPEKFLPCCRKQISVVNQKSANHSSIEKYKSFHKNTCDLVAAALDKKSIPYSVTEITFEFGQPLASFEEGKQFVRKNYPKVTEADLYRFLSQNLVETNQTDYPFYLPKKKSLGIFEIEGRCQ